MAHNHEHTDQQMVKMEVNLDDTPGEWLGYVMERLFAAGANDVFYTPIFMKKNRPGVMLQLLCTNEKLETMQEILFSETTTLGIRYYPLTVHRLERRFYTVSTDWGEVTVKEGRYQGKVVQRSPEYEDCRLMAQQAQVPLKKVYEAVWEKIRQQSNV